MNHATAAEAAWSPTRDITPVGLQDLTARQIPAAGWWMFIQAVVDPAAEEPLYAAYLLPPNAAFASTGEIALHLRPAAEPAPGHQNPRVDAEVVVVLDTEVVPVASWEDLHPTFWPDVVTPSIAFADRMLGRLDDAGVITGPYTPVALPADPAAVPQADATRR